MESVEYDLDTSGGLMPQIQQLIAPPSLNDDCMTHKKDRRYRRPGRTVNHDNCDSCREGGDLICCDRCPAAFHLQCYDPPLTEDDLPSGEWLCHRCKHSPKLEDKSSTSNEGPKNPPDTKIDNGSEVTMDVDSANDSQSEVKEMSSSAAAFQKLTEAAALLNPNQFELPSDILCMSSLPGYGKRLRNNNGSRTGKKIAHELDNGLVPLPARLCFQCRMSCHVAPLIQCDFCPLLFHADCLDPPITALPTGKWMCPNHAEHTVDQQLLTTASFTERVKLWDKYSGSINPGPVILRFLNKANRRAPPFRHKVKLKSRTKIKVPQSIVEHYKNPAHLLPRTDSVPLSSHSLCNSCSLSEEEEWLSSVVAFQGQVAKHLTLKPSIHHDSEDTKCSVSTNIEALDCKFLCSKFCDEKGTYANQNGPISDSIFPNGDLESSEKNCQLKTECEHDVDISATPESTQLNTVVIQNRTAGCNKLNNMVNTSQLSRTSLPNCVNSQPNHVQSPNITDVTSSFKSISSINENSCLMEDKISSTSTLKSDVSCSTFGSNLASKLQLAVQETESIEVDHLDFKLTQALAYQRLQQLYPEKCLIQSTIKRENCLITDLPDIQARALILPFVGKGPSVSMCYRTLNIGVGADMDVCLSNYGHCNYVSSKHACIFYDEVTRHYELLNYSEHGTVVDSVLYSCDLSQKPKPSAPPNSLSHSVRKLAKSTPRLADLTPTPLATLDRPVMSARIRERYKMCNCKTSGPHDVAKSNVGWEGTAIIHHGSFIRCGCLQFVFSITDYGSLPASLDDSKSDELTCTASSNTSTASSSNASLLGD